MPLARSPRLWIALIVFAPPTAAGLFVGCSDETSPIDEADATVEAGPVAADFQDAASNTDSAALDAADAADVETVCHADPEAPDGSSDDCFVTGAACPTVCGGGLRIHCKDGDASAGYRAPIEAGSCYMLPMPDNTVFPLAACCANTACVRYTTLDDDCQFRRSRPTAVSCTLDGGPPPGYSNCVVGDTITPTSTVWCCD